MKEYKLSLINTEDDLNAMAAKGWEFTGATLKSGYSVFVRERVAKAKAAAKPKRK